MSEEFKFNPLFVVDDSSYFDKLKNDSLIKVFEREENIGKLESLIYKRKRKLDLVRSEIDGEDIEPRRISKEELSDKFDEICQDVDDFLGIDLSLRPKIGFTNYFSSKTNGISNYLGLTFILASTISIPFAQMLTEYEHLPLSLRVAQVAFSIFGIKSFVDYSNIKGMFDPRNNEIKMDSKDESLVQFMAHEYAHFVQGYLLKDEKKQSQDFLIFREGHAIGVQNFISRKYFDDSSDRSQLEMNLKLNMI